MSMTATTTDVEIRVLLFASYAERLGQDVLELHVPVATTVADVLERLRALPGGDQLPRRPLCALNLSHVGLDVRVSEGDELAILPPLAGG